uniref:Uncharacterized protein n=1 Tax=Cannabis sativa TaxID=3483 RepID=A0A803P4F2_CANSA
MNGHSVSNCNKDKGVSWKKKTIVENFDKNGGNKVAATEVKQQHSKEVKIVIDVRVEKQQSKGIEEQDKRLDNAQDAEIEERGANIFVAIVPTIQVESSHNSIQLDDNLNNSNSWFTPKRRGTKQVVVVPHKAITSNGYAVLQEAKDGILVTNSNLKD